MVYATLLEQFLREECTPHVRRLICAAATERSTQVRREFEFNRFNLVLDFEAGRVVLDDELDVSPAGSFELSLDELWTAIGCSGGGND